MSQEKVDRYKEKKHNRQKLMKREKLIHRLEYTAAALVAVAMIGWVGYSFYAKAANVGEPESYQMDCTSINEYMNSLDG